MTTSDKYSCRCVAAALKTYGVKHVVVSPGSRNSPLIVALSRTDGLKCHVVIDERSAGFFALGIAVETGQPVAMVCTSGSAVLNYAPALAEAYYRRVPLIAVTADRPEEWIDQDDSQTIHQMGALDAVVKGAYDIPVDRGDAALRRLCVRRISDALISAISQPAGPVQINVQIDEPLNAMCEEELENFLFPAITRPEYCLPQDYAHDLACRINEASRVIVLAGFMPPNEELNRLLASLPSHVAVLCETTSNLANGFVANIDASLRAMTYEEKPQLLDADIVITIGGSLISRMIKAELRKRDIENWNVGLTLNSVDPLLHLTRRIDSDPLGFFRATAPYLHDKESGYRSMWQAVSARAMKRSSDFLTMAPWSDYAAMGHLLRNIPPLTVLHLSNGTSVRYAQLFAPLDIARVECNRGVSGIDGCTSTAIGSSVVSGLPTLLITGDMCAQYDMAALACTEIPSSFRMVVLNNGGGGIFRFIKATRELPEMERFLAADVRLPLRQLADGFGFDYYEADSLSTMDQQLPAFFAAGSRPAILNIITPAAESAETIRKYFSKP
ncbi:MAG: 2-succinyl-5-enolpyruvyl-6-hydroxy-3-cyclohexene-1-carboxylic-acid synthase [Muribaculaceae bacterium]|nr:2-succinyl-5-enolpyruvyl-6-hydroxy-3-cyclohexene-1-carboxylic-acid synthase [Muribaculaceae bacterium]